MILKDEAPKIVSKATIMLSAPSKPYLLTWGKRFAKKLSNVFMN